MSVRPLCHGGAQCRAATLAWLLPEAALMLVLLQDYAHGSCSPPALQKAKDVLAIALAPKNFRAYSVHVSAWRISLRTKCGLKMWRGTVSFQVPLKLCAKLQIDTNVILAIDALMFSLPGDGLKSNILDRLGQTTPYSLL